MIECLSQLLLSCSLICFYYCSHQCNIKQLCLTNYTDVTLCYQNLSQAFSIGVHRSIVSSLESRTVQ